ncbi:restriction endonuclease subunit R [Microseira wollei]|uniref:Restriction endonuclease subunit R n=1 Tax=Microseira wollei NIES-4236 TaxID=2530354 RepID=A0AAV3XUC1_9CYAN|nr:restriction endonuclease subunit R [Microseira wollei]GET43992.1 hypothetical protein MiSe_88180 [Microseira wollei NIES-4236]
MTTLNAKTLTLREVVQMLKFEKIPNGSLTSLLSLQPLTEFEQQELGQIRDDFDSYLIDGKVSEGQLKLLSVAPLLRLAGFYRSPVKLVLEESLADIAIEDEGTIITGRFDILAVNANLINNVAFVVLVIETKNSLIDVVAGLPQLLTYADKILDDQTSVWSLATNGARYQFVYIQPGERPTYQLMPLLNLMDFEPAIQILQTLKAICQLTQI